MNRISQRTSSNSIRLMQGQLADQRKAKKWIARACVRSSGEIRKREYSEGIRGTLAYRRTNLVNSDTMKDDYRLL